MTLNSENSEPSSQQWACPRLPLAVYREVVAHLRQVPGVDAGLLPQRSTEFDYRQSQVGGLWIQVAVVDPPSQQRVNQILAYYGDRYGHWQVIET